MRPTKAVTLFDGTSAANTAFDSGDLNTADFDSLLVEVIPSGAAGASVLSFYDSAFSTSTAIYTVATGATAVVKTSGWGVIAPDATVGERLAGLPAPLPALARIGIGALGVGITARLRVIGRRNFKEFAGPTDPVTRAPTEI